MSIHNSKNHLKVVVTNYSHEIKFGNFTEPILEYVAILKDIDGVCSTYDFQNFIFSGDYFQSEDTWHGKVHMSEINYDVSRANPYTGEYSMFFYFKSESLILIITLTMPSLVEIKLSGLHVQLGIMGANFYNVAEEASAIIRGWSDKAMRDVINKEIAEGNDVSNVFGNNFDENDLNSDFYGDMEENCYE